MSVKGYRYRYSAQCAHCGERVHRAQNTVGTWRTMCEPCGYTDYAKAGTSLAGKYDAVYLASVGSGKPVSVKVESVKSESKGGMPWDQ